MTAEHQVRYFEFKDDKSSKFWEISQAGNIVRVRYGKLGTSGQSQEKSFLDEADSTKHVNKLIKEKTGKGYVEKSLMASFEPVEVGGQRSSIPDASPAKSKSSDKNKAWTPKLTKKGKFSGPYPEIIDFSKEIPVDLLTSENTIWILSNDPNVRSVKLSNMILGVRKLVVENLPALEDLSITGEPNGILNSFQWVEIHNTPSLKILYLSGDVSRLEITESGSLIDLDISHCPEIIRASLSEPNPDLKINAEGCLKLREIIGINDELSSSSGLEGHITKNKSASRQDGTIYESMTIDDFNLVLDDINQGAKAMSQAGFLSEQDCSILGCYDIYSYDPNFVPFDAMLLQFDEPVYTGGTGETYDFAIDIAYVCSDLDVTYHEEGASSPEDCLRTILHFIRMACIKEELSESSDEELLKFLQQSAKTYLDDQPRLPIVFSSGIPEDQKEAAIDLANEIGMKVVDDAMEWFVYVRPEFNKSRLGDDIFPDNATIIKTVPELMIEMKRLKEWQLHRVIKP